jgi:hypothetical protein
MMVFVWNRAAWGRHDALTVMRRGLADSGRLSFTLNTPCS